MRCSLGQTWKVNTCVSWIKNYTWQAALDASKTLNSQGGYAGYRDWRVPTKEELKTLIYCSSDQPKTWNDMEISCQGDYNRPTIYQPLFPKTPEKGRYWSSTVYVNESNVAWSINFDDGYVSTNDSSSNGRVRLVRDRQSVAMPAAVSTSSTKNSVKPTNPQKSNKSRQSKQPVKSSPKKHVPNQQPSPAKEPEPNWIKVM